MTALAASMICVVDDDESVRVATAALLRSAGFRVESFNSAESFLERGQVRDFSCLILDLRMPGIDGLETQRRLNATDSRLPIIFISAHDDSVKRKKAMDAGAAAFFHKPFHGDSLLAVIASAVGGPDDAVELGPLVLPEAASTPSRVSVPVPIVFDTVPGTGGSEVPLASKSEPRKWPLFWLMMIAPLERW